MAVAHAIPTFDLLYNALEPLRGDLLDIKSLEEEILFVVGCPAINHELNILEMYMIEIYQQKSELNMEQHFQMMHSYFNTIRQIYYDCLLMDWWYSDEISMFEEASIEIYQNIMDTFGPKM